MTIEYVSREVYDAMKRERDEAQRRLNALVDSLESMQARVKQAERAHDKAQAALLKITRLVKESIDWAGRNRQAVYAKLAFALADLADKATKR